MQSQSPGDVLTLIPARKGSKGLPGKNVRAFRGQPLTGRAVAHAVDSKVAGRIVVSTDDPGVAEIAVAYGAEVPFLRPDDLARDDSPVLATALHAIDWFSTHEGWNPRWLLLLQPTSPLRTSEDICRAFQILATRDADAVVGVSEMKAHPFWGKTISPDGFLQPFVSAKEASLQRQKLPAALVLNGMVYLVRVDTLRAEETFCPSRSLPLVIPAIRAIDIDTEHDFLLAEFASTLCLS